MLLTFSADDTKKLFTGISTSLDCQVDIVLQESQVLDSRPEVVVVFEQFILAVVGYLSFVNVLSSTFHPSIHCREELAQLGKIRLSNLVTSIKQAYISRSRAQNSR